MNIGTPTEPTISGLRTYLKEFLSDDLLDITGTKISVGKPVRGDKKKGKSTLIKLLGYKKTLEFALRRKKMIIAKLKKYGN